MQAIHMTGISRLWYSIRSIIREDVRFSILWQQPAAARTDRRWAPADV